MSVIEYVSVFVSIVLGLAVAELGSSFHKLMRARRRVQWDWMSLALALVMLLEVVQFWWLSHDWYAQSAGLRLASSFRISSCCCSSISWRQRCCPMRFRSKG